MMIKRTVKANDVNHYLSILESCQPSYSQMVRELIYSNKCMHQRLIIGCLHISARFLPSLLIRDLRLIPWAPIH